MPAHIDVGVVFSDAKETFFPIHPAPQLYVALAKLASVRKVKVLNQLLYCSKPKKDLKCGSVKLVVLCNY